jgi:aspartate racemase
MRPIIGALAGMGPLAGADFLARLTLAHATAARDQDHPQVVLFSATQVPDRTAAALDGGPSPLPALLRGIRLLEQAGAGCIAMPCNSAHVWFDAMQAETRLPILHIVDAAAAALPPGARTIGLMGTRATLRLELYQRRLAARGYTCITPTDAEMADAVVPAIAAVKANDVAAATAPLLSVARSLAARGAQAVVLGCTEIPLALRGAEAGVPMVDTVDALARAALAWWASQTSAQPPPAVMSAPVT